MSAKNGRKKSENVISFALMSLRFTEPGGRRLKIQILMSTYNGEKYLPEQMDSLLSQSLCKSKDMEVTIRIRDDGSTDKTCHILQEYAEKYPQIQYKKEKNTGVIESFFRLMDDSDRDADFLAFCDQDDVWMPEKLERALDKIQEKSGDKTEEKPILYCGRPLHVDENLNPVDTVWQTGKLRPSFGNALVENICIGCTAVINRPLADLLRLEHPEFTIMHDRWIYLLASCFGEVIYDEKPHIKYRQHGDNTVGMKRNYWQEFVERLKKYREKRGAITKQAQSFLSYCEHQNFVIPEDEKTYVSDILAMKKHLGARIRLIRNDAIYRQRKGDDRIFKFLILLGNI
jgi:glycosyltransferase involved in cell wall biosynthesis